MDDMEIYEVIQHIILIKKSTERTDKEKLVHYQMLTMSIASVLSGNAEEFIKKLDGTYDDEIGDIDGLDRLKGLANR